MATKHYPDLHDLLAKRAEGRKQRARASVVEKLDVLDKLKAGAETFRTAQSPDCNKAALERLPRK